MTLQASTTATGHRRLVVLLAALLLLILCSAYSREVRSLCKQEKEPHSLADF